MSEGEVGNVYRKGAGAPRDQVRRCPRYHIRRGAQGLSSGRAKVTICAFNSRMPMLGASAERTEEVDYKCQGLLVLGLRSYEGPSSNGKGDGERQVY